MGLALTCQRLGQRDAVSLSARSLTAGTEITLKHVALLNAKIRDVHCRKTVVQTALSSLLKPELSWWS
jgi:hypothetical protein